MDLKKLLNAIDISGDWVGLRYVKEDTTFRIVRDGNPEANSRESKQGIMVEVLVDGQFAYYGTSQMDQQGVLQAAQKANDMARAAASFGIHKFDNTVRPVAKG